MRRVRPGLSLLAAALASAGCDEVRLVDPTAVPIEATGAVIEAAAEESGAGARLGVVAHAYGKYEQDGEVLLRYLHAGEVTVADRPAERRYVRPGEPQYSYEGTLEPAPPRFPVRVDGSSQVPGCTFEVGLPLPSLPPEGTVLARGEPLVIPLGFASESLPSTHSVRATVRLAAEAIAEISIVKEYVRGPLTVPAAFLTQFPQGRLDLALELEWEQPTGGIWGGDCPLNVQIRAAFHARRSLVLR